MARPRLSVSGVSIPYIPQVISIYKLQYGYTRVVDYALDLFYRHRLTNETVSFNTPEAFIRVVYFSFWRTRLGFTSYFMVSGLRDYPCSGHLQVSSHYNSVRFAVIVSKLRCRKLFCLL